MFVALLAAGTASLADIRVVDTLQGDEFARAGIVGEILDRPAGVGDEEFARSVMEATGLRPRSGQPILQAPSEGTMGTAAIIAANGHQVIVKYVAGDREHTGRICRLRFEPGVDALAPARWSAFRWCASAFGLRLPATRPPPPIRTIALGPGAQASGDFDRDGVVDRAHVREAGGTHELVVERGAGGTSVVQAVDPLQFYLGVLDEGTYATACGKGHGSDATPCRERSVTLDSPTLEFGMDEGSQAVALWDGQRFRVVWLAD